MKRIISYIFTLALAIPLVSNLTLEEEDPSKVTFPELKGHLIQTNASNTINIRMIPHSHDDIGWLKTVDQYYVNSQKSITIQGVQYILDSVFPVLNADPNKKFMYVEMGFFERWWNEQDQTMQALVKKLLANGQFEFINGGYCMNDEAAVYYEDSIDQMTLGHQFLLQNFNFIPTVGWHIDPFGHASAQAALFAQMGFKAFFFARIDYQDKDKRLDDKSMEMIWIPNTSQGVENAMFTHVNYYHYSNPSGFNFDIIAQDQPIQDDANLEGYDVDRRANTFIGWFRQMQASYRTNDLFHTAGEDFHYMAAGIDFKNWDKLFKYIRSVPSFNANVFYNIPSEYLKLIYPQGVTYPTKTDDFFPYADGDNAYWTGYFTSRVSMKVLVRESGKWLQASRRLATQLIWDKSSQYVSSNFPTIDKAIYQLEDAMAIGQHHDAVTGTEKQAVAEDYKFRLAKGVNAVNSALLFPYFQEKIQADLGISGAQLSTCQLNVSATFCGATYSNLQKNTPVLLAIYNSGNIRSSNIRVKVPNGNVQVKDSTGADVPTDVICSNSTDTTDCDLFFTANFAGFATSYFYLAPSSQSNLVSPKAYTPNYSYAINSNQTFTVTDMSNFAFSYCQNPQHTQCYSSKFSLAYNYYESYQGDGQKSGAYIFRPSDKTRNAPLSYATPTSLSVYQGKTLLQIHTSSDKIIADLRIYNDLTNGIELQSYVNSISTDDGQGKEVVVSVKVPSITNNNIFYTDSMGLELQKRVLNFRPTWDLTVTQPVSGNYYPVLSTILINDTASGESLAIIPDRSQGGGSINAGQIELMIHRRTTDDDARGVGEALDEHDFDGKGLRQWITHTLLFNFPGYIQTSYRQVQLDKDVANLVLLAPTTKTPFLEEQEEEENGYGFGGFGQQIKLLSRPLSTTKFVLRFQNMDDVTSHSVSTVVFNRNGAKGTPVEMSLTYNQAKTDMIKNRFDWNKLGLNNPAFAKTDYLNSDQFLLRPLEIRTFIVTFTSNEEMEMEMEMNDDVLYI